MNVRVSLGFLVACGTGFQANPTHHYHLEVQAGFNPDEAQAIFDAADEWEKSSGGFVTFDGAYATTDTISFSPATAWQISAEFGGGSYVGSNQYEGQSSSIDLETTLGPELFHQTALHEIGHAIGLVHITPGNVMCANATCATLVIACGDLTQLMGYAPSGCWP